MEWFQIIVMAIVQGISEFLPISSSGHLLILDELFRSFGSKPQFDEIMLNVFLHFGTLIAVLFVYRKRLFLLFTKDKRLILLLIIATIPAVVIGYPVKEYCDNILKSTLLAGCCFPITGLCLLWLSDRSGTTICRNLPIIRSLWIGLAQAAALLPGISRSGSTITASLLCGLKRDEAATFSFLLSIPVIGGGTLLETKDLIEIIQEKGSQFIFDSIPMLAAGVLISCLVGIIALNWLIHWLEQGKLKYFAYYLFTLGPIVIIWQLFTRFF
ncbi:MAG: undecaprenyl-diphosphate phosphatase [Planctomycetaceae bacterium]|jgi:undecaprenyl-diphosphatase|nr:undecaprenyl-diphosphate phosphatase [Planctomycetaceae bacterium]